MKRARPAFEHRIMGTQPSTSEAIERSAAVARLELSAVPARFEEVVATIGRFTVECFFFHPRYSGDANFLRSRRHAARHEGSILDREALLPRGRIVDGTFRCVRNEGGIRSSLPGANGSGRSPRERRDDYPCGGPSHSCRRRPPSPVDGAETRVGRVRHCPRDPRVGARSGIRLGFGAPGVVLRRIDRSDLVPRRRDPRVPTPSVGMRIVLRTASSSDEMLARPVFSVHVVP